MRRCRISRSRNVGVAKLQMQKDLDFSEAAIGFGAGIFDLAGNAAGEIRRGYSGRVDLPGQSGWIGRTLAFRVS